MSLVNKFSDKISDLQIRNQKTFILVLIGIILVSIPGTFFLVGNVEASLEKVLPSDVTEVKKMNDMRSLFGADMMYVVFYTSEYLTDIRDPSAVEYINLISKKIEENEYILGTRSYVDILEIYNEGNIPQSKREISEILSLDQTSNQYVSDDYSMTFIEVTSDTGASSRVIREVVDKINYDINSLERYNPGLEIGITGFNAIDKATFDVIISDFMKIMIVSFVLMTAFLFVYFRDPIKVFTSLLTIIVSLIITLGLTGYLGITITVVTMVAAAMIMALGISYGINVNYEYFLLRRNYLRKKSLKMLNSSLIKALLGSSLTTSAGFLALLFGVMPAMKNLGIILAMGIVITLAFSVFFLPIIIYLLDSKD